MLKNTKPKWYDPLIQFATHIIVAMAIFALIAYSAFLLHLLVDWMQDHHLDVPLVYVLKALTYLIMCVDAGAFVIYLFKETNVFVKEILK